MLFTKGSLVKVAPVFFGNSTMLGEVLGTDPTQLRHKIWYPAQQMTAWVSTYRLKKLDKIDFELFK